MEKMTSNHWWRIALMVGLVLVASIQSTHSFAQDLADDNFDMVAAPAGTAGLEFLNKGNRPGSVEDLRAMERVFGDVIEMAAPATVNVSVDEAQGSGVIVSRDGYILTAAHVISRPNLEAKITFADGSTANAITLGINRTFDSGMLKITDEGKWPFLDIGESDPLNPGQWVMAIGHPGGLTEGRGLVYRVGRILENGEGHIATDCTLVGGDSGGPLVDLDGYVVGIHSRIGGRLRDNFHVPVDRFSNDWDKLAASAIVGVTRAYVGLDLDKSEKTQIKVKSVEKNEAAANAGIQIGDVIIKINDTEVKTYKDFKRSMLKFKPTDVAAFVVKRGEEEIEFELTMGYYWK